MPAAIFAGSMSSATAMPQATSMFSTLKSPSRGSEISISPEGSATTALVPSRRTSAERSRTAAQLAVHLFDEGGGFRTHVLCFHNDTNTRWLESLDVLLQDGDRITFLQAVSGG